MEERKFYYCEHCKNLFGVVQDGGVVPTCCGKPMVLLAANTTDAAQEKHVPSIQRNGSILSVQIGTVQHPMLEEHYIPWVLAAQGRRVQRVRLEPGDAPSAAFALDDADSPVAVYAYCNLHGLWRADA